MGISQRYSGDVGLRRQTILEFVNAQPVSSQSALKRYLGEKGMRVSAMTISRDLESLEIVKVRGLDGRMTYRESRSGKSPSSQRWIADRVVAIAVSDPPRVRDDLKRAHLLGVIDVIGGDSAVWVAATHRGIQAVRKWFDIYHG